jgi:hypothetical protein
MSPHPQHSPPIDDRSAALMLILLTLHTFSFFLCLLLSISDNHADSYFYQPFTNDFPRADIHEMLSPDLLHQVIKGTFKDHLVMWVEEYLVLTHGQVQANVIMTDIDRR